ncbi:MAG: tRNA(Met) cytidine acetyltransferase [Candidatus Heimdallarchaeota archaeon]|nr:tRNA(Met) cytidine acetyltransferase [Candidatus Heimdallarchaeota archaeon]
MVSTPYNRSIFLFQDEIISLDSLFEWLKNTESNKNAFGAIITDSSHLKAVIQEKFNLISSSLEKIFFYTTKDIPRLLGQTIDFIFIDFRGDISANSMCILLECIRGGGLIFLLITSQDLKSYLQGWNGKFPTSIFRQWFFANLSECSEHLLINPKKEEIQARFNPMPYAITLSKKIIEIPVSEEQQRFINTLLLKLVDNKSSNFCSVLTANRGRGKSAAVGIAIGIFLTDQVKHPFYINISSPYLSNCQTLFKFITLIFSLKGRDPLIRKKDNMIYELSLSNKIKITYLNPDEVIEKSRANLVIFEEASAIPVDILKAILARKVLKIYIATIHGYEGGGRGFQYKILKYLERQEKIHVSNFELKTPIRYLSEDNIEEFLNKVYLLNAEAQELPEHLKNIENQEYNSVSYKNTDQLFSKEGSNILRNHIGLLLHSHYRNQPNDLELLANSEKHYLEGIYSKIDTNKNFLFVSILISEEGLLDDDEISLLTSGKFLEGNLIPSVIIRYFSEEFSNLKGLRIVRIATHPSLMNRGLGKVAVSHLINKNHDNDWLGVSFGATRKLVKFWGKLGFVPVHIRPIKTKETGTWNLVMIQPLSLIAKRIIPSFSKDFQLQFINLLRHSLHSMEPEIVQEILKWCNNIPSYAPELTSSGKYRLKQYLEGKINFLLAVDSIYALTMKYFVTKSSIKLSNSQEILLITRVLQGRTWGQTMAISGLKWNVAQGLLEKAVKKISKLVEN